MLGPFMSLSSSVRVIRFPNQNLIKCGEVSLIQSLIFFMVVLYLLEFEAVSHVIEVSASMKCSLDYKTLLVILVTKKIPLSASLSPTGKTFCYYRSFLKAR